MGNGSSSDFAAPPYACGMRHLSRFVEPVILLILKEKGHSYGYDLAGEVPTHALTDAAIEKAALYRTLRMLEEAGHVVSDWDVRSSGPARRVYSLTPEGERHLMDWAGVLGRMSVSLAGFAKKVDSLSRKEREAGAAQRTALAAKETIA